MNARLTQKISTVPSLCFSVHARARTSICQTLPQVFEGFLFQGLGIIFHTLCVCAASLRPSFTLTTPVSRSLWLVFNITLISLDFQRCWFVLSFLLKYFFSLPSSL
uniref:(northern house mosquito) hypothetical protein n=1 Tax=Culex pipiens TaxID=7175 RepID=A0A8D8P3Z9_CULPI